MNYTIYEKFMGNRIIGGHISYSEVAAARPDLQAGIKVYLSEQGRTDLIET